MKKTKGKKWILVILAVLVIVLGGSCMVVTYPNEYAVVKQFGKIVSVRENPGLSVKVPLSRVWIRLKKKCCSMIWQSVML